MSRHMRTTVRLDDALLEQAKREAARRRETLTALIEQGLRLLLAQSRARARPSRVADAIAFASVLLEQSHCQLIQPGDRHWKIYSDLCRRANATGNLTQDAWYAALAIEAGCEWITTDRDFARFEGLLWRAP